MSCLNNASHVGWASVFLLAHPTTTWLEFGIEKKRHHPAFFLIKSLVMTWCHSSWHFLHNILLGHESASSKYFHGAQWCCSRCASFRQRSHRPIFCSILTFTSPWRMTSGTSDFLQNSWVRLPHLVQKYGNRSRPFESSILMMPQYGGEPQFGHGFNRFSFRLNITDQHIHSAKYRLVLISHPNRRKTLRRLVF